MPGIPSDLPPVTPRKSTRVLPCKVIETQEHENSKGLNIYTKRYSRQFAIDRGRGIEMVQVKAYREGRETVLGYGNGEQEAIDDLKYAVQPDWDGTLDGEGKPQGCAIGGNVFPISGIVEHNKSLFSKE